MKRLQKVALYSLDAFVFYRDTSHTQFGRSVGALVAEESRKDGEVIKRVPSDGKVCSSEANFPSPNVHIGE